MPKEFATHCDTEARFFNSLQQAEAQAVSDINSCRKDAEDVGDGWDEETTEEIVVMQVIRRAKKVDPKADYRCVDYELAALEDDWRIGQRVAGKYRSTRFFGQLGFVIETHPDGWHGIHDETGVLVVKLDTGETMVAGADDWRTA